MKCISITYFNYLYFNYYTTLIWSHICVFDWYQNHRPWRLGWPWTAVSSNFLGILRYFACLGLNEWRYSYYQQQQCSPVTLISGNIRLMRILAGASNDNGVVDGNFGDLSGYFFGNLRDKTSNITWRYATPCRPVIDCKMNDPECLCHVKIRFRPARLSRAYLCVS